MPIISGKIEELVKNKHILEEWLKGYRGVELDYKFGVPQLDVKGFKRYIEVPHGVVRVIYENNGQVPPFALLLNPKTGKPVALLLVKSWFVSKKWPEFPYRVSTEVTEIKTGTSVENGVKKTWRRTITHKLWSPPTYVIKKETGKAVLLERVLNWNGQLIVPEINGITSKWIPKSVLLTITLPKK